MTCFVGGECPNPRCDRGNVPGGALGLMLCPDCVREGRWHRLDEPVRLIGRRTFPDAVSSPLDPPRVS